jgi:ERCC4-related helicase
MNYLKKIIYKKILSKFINYINSCNKFIFIIDLYAKQQKLFSTHNYQNYNKYKNIQINTNIKKINLGVQYVEKKDIKNICDYLKKKLKKKKLL